MRGKLAHDNRARRAQLCDHRRVGIGDMIQAQPRVAGCRHSLDVDDILDRDRNTKQKSSWQCRIGSSRTRAFAVKIHKCVELGVEPLDPRK